MNFGMTQLKNNGLTMIDLFCGAGIGAYGFKKAGFDIVYALDNMEYAVKSYNKNIGNHAHKVDIKKLDLTTLPDVDIIAGGFPCTTFSLGGAGEGEENKKIGDLAYYFLKAVDVKQPKAFFLENVKGLLSKKHRPFFDKLLKEFDKAGYNVKFKLSDCYEYGVPQIRERVFVIGVRKDIEEEYEYPEVLKKEERIHIREALSGLPCPDSNHNVPNHKDYYGDGFSPRYLSRNRQRQWDEPSYTVVSTARQLPLYPEPANYDVRVRDIKKDKPPRRFTVRECLRLQTVPDDFIFGDDIKYEQQQTRCSGIPSLMAYKLSLPLIDILKK